MDMKRWFLLFLLALGASGFHAQDTIPFLDPCFVYPRISTAVVFGGISDTTPTQYLADPSGMELITDDPYPASWGNEFYTLFIEPSHPTIYGFAITTTNDSPSTLPPHIRIRLLSNIKQNDYGTLSSHNIDSIDTDSSFYQKNMNFTYCFGDGDSAAVPCQLYFFNQLPADGTLPDTFFVELRTAELTRFPYLFMENNYHISCLRDDWADSFLTHNIVFSHNVFTLATCWGGCFPIRELPCPRMWKPSTVSRSGGRTTLGWQEGDTALYQLVFHDDQGALVFETDTLRTNTFVLTDSLLDAVGYSGNRYFDVRVRKACNYMDSPFHTLVWNTYSEPRHFYHLQASPQGIDAVDEPVLTVAPNPAKERLAVECEAGTLRLVDLEGRAAMSMRLPGGRTELDVAALPRGIYLLRLVTDSGCVTRRVVLL